MTREQIIQGLYRGDGRAIKEAIKALEKQDRIAQILDDYDYDLLDTWEALKMVKEAMKK